MACPDRYDLTITDSDGESHGLLLDWAKGGAGLSFRSSTDIKSTAVSTKGDFGIRDSADHFRIIQSDWSEGQGQKTYDREADSESSFDASRSIDISNVGELRLGPQLRVISDTSVYPTIIAHSNSGNATPLIWFARTSATTNERVHYWAVGDGDSFAIGTAGLGGPDASPTAFASDGETLFLATCTSSYVDGHVQWVNYQGSAQYGSETGITDLAFTSGTLYGCKGGALGGADARLGTFDSSAVWSPLSPHVASAINAAGATFGLVASGSYVYWGVTNQMLTSVYRARYGGGAGADTLEAVVTFPAGFVGASMFAYLGTVYVGGHWDGPTPYTGIGSIYSVFANQPALLTDVGTDHTRDNRVLAMTAYERSLYFVSDSQVWRWDIVRGGYSHYMGPLDINPVSSTSSYPDLAWTTYDFTSQPGGATTVGGTNGTLNYGVAMSGATCCYVSPGAALTTYAYVSPTLSNATGTTLEFVIPANGMQATGNLSTAYGFVYLDDGTVRISCQVYRPGSTGGPYFIKLMNGWSSVIGSVYVDGHTASRSIMLTLQGNSAKLYVDKVLSINTYADSPSPNIAGIGWGASLSPSSQVAMYFDRLRWTASTYDPGGALSPVSGVALAAAADCVVAACSGYGIVSNYPIASGYTTTPTDGKNYLRSSRSSGNMPTVEKYFKEIDLTLVEELRSEDGITITVAGTIDNVAFGPVEADTSDTQTLVFPIGKKGRVIQYDIIIDSTNTKVSPRIGEASVVFDPQPNTPKTHTYYVKCWRDAESRTSGIDWDEDAPTVADWLEDICGQIVTVERPGGQASYNGRIEALEYVEASPSGRSNGREGLYQLQLKVV